MITTLILSGAQRERYAKEEEAYLLQWLSCGGLDGKVSYAEYGNANMNFYKGYHIFKRDKG